MGWRDREQDPGNNENARSPAAGRKATAFLCPENTGVGGSAIALHRGDACSVLRELPAETYEAVIADPPYCSGGRTKGEREKLTSGKYQNSENRGLYPEFLGDQKDQRSYLAWSALWLSEAWRCARQGALVAVFSDWRQLPVTTDAVQAAGWLWLGILPWDKTEGCRPQRGRFRQQCEYVVWGAKGKLAIDRGCPAGLFRMSQFKEKKRHIAGKPVALMAHLLQLVRGPVLDPFMGSAPIGAACLEAGLPYTGIELDPHWFDHARERLSATSYREISTN